MTDAQIVMSIMQNDSRGWRYICRNMKQGFAAILARTFSFGRTADADIEDIFQDSCIVLMQKVKEGKFAITGENSVFKFLVKIGINNACNFIRKHRPLTSKEEVTVTLNLHDDNQDVELSVDEQQQAQDEFLDRAFDSLPDTCKAIFKKFYWERKSMDEIADIIGYNTADSVKSKKSNCMKKFKDFAKKLLESDEFAEEAVRATAERAALRELLEEERIYAESGIIMAALDIDDEPEKEDK